MLSMRFGMKLAGLQRTSGLVPEQYSERQEKKTRHSPRETLKYYEIRNSISRVRLSSHCDSAICFVSLQVT